VLLGHETVSFFMESSPVGYGFQRTMEHAQQTSSHRLPAGEAS
jgi:hypothetical protein